MEKIYLSGNLTRDPVLEKTADGTSVCHFTIAVNPRGAAARQKSEPHFYRISVWRQSGENCAKYLTKGRKVLVVGTLNPRLYNGQDGVQRLSLDVTADDCEFIGNAAIGAQQQTSADNSGAQSAGDESGANHEMRAPESGNDAGEEGAGQDSINYLDDEELPF